MKKVMFAAAVLCLTAGAVFAQSAEVPYESMLEQVKSGKTDINFKAFRLAYTKTPDYNARGIDPKERGRMADLIRNKKFSEAVEAAENVLKTNYVDMSAHIYASMAHTELKNADKAAFHEQVYVGLINSIVEGRNGEDAKSAYEIISMAEEFQVLQALEYRRRSQTIAEEGGKRYGIITAIDTQNNSEVKIFFDINSFASLLPAEGQRPGGPGRGERPQRP